MRHVAIVEGSRMTTTELLADADIHQHRDLEVESICERLRVDLSKRSPSRKATVAAVLYRWPG